MEQIAEQPNAWLLNPVDAEVIDLQREGAGGQYLMGPAAELFGARARTRQMRGEHCAALISAAATCRHGILEVNDARRAEGAGEYRGPDWQMAEMINEVNEAEATVQRMGPLLRLYGPDDLSDKARDIAQAEQEVVRLIDSGVGAPYAPFKYPDDLHAAATVLHSKIEEFAVLARAHTR